MLCCYRLALAPVDEEEEEGRGGDDADEEPEEEETHSSARSQDRQVGVGPCGCSTLSAIALSAILLPLKVILPPLLHSADTLPIEQARYWLPADCSRSSSALSSVISSQRSSAPSDGVMVDLPSVSDLAVEEYAHI